MRVNRALPLAAYLALVFALADGCATPQGASGRPTAAPEGASTRRSPEAGRFAPTAAAAVRYNDPPIAATSSLDRVDFAIVEATQRAASQTGLARVVLDARLSLACSDLAALVGPDGMLSSDVVQFALQHHGIVEPSPLLIVLWGRVDSPQVADEIARRFVADVDRDAAVRFGVGKIARSADGTGAIVFAGLSSAITTEPIDRALPAGGTVRIAATLDPRFRAPEVLVTRDSGEVERVPASPDGGSGFTAEVACGARRGRQQIEVLGTGPRGIKVLANFPIWCGVEPPRSLTVEASADEAPDVDAATAERQLLELVNRDRKAAGLAPLARDARVAQVARAYSAEMQRTNVVAHVSRSSGAAIDRVRAGGIRTGLVLENIAHTYAVAEAHRGLMESPGHRANILSPLATHVGIGVARGARVADRVELFVTEVFIRIPPKVDVGAARAAILQKIAAAKAAAGRGAQLAQSSPLDAIAQPFAEALAAGEPHEAAYADAFKQLDRLSRVYSFVGSSVGVSGEIETFDGAGVVKSSTFEEVGIGIAQGNHPELGPGAIWVVVLSGQRRVQ